MYVGNIVAVVLVLLTVPVFAAYAHPLRRDRALIVIICTSAPIRSRIPIST